MPSCLEPYRAYLEARFVDDPHVRGSVLFGELVRLGFARSYPTLVREIRELALRPVCGCCKAGGVTVTVGLDHEPGEELQLDWLELNETPWGEKAYVLTPPAKTGENRLRSKGRPSARKPDHVETDQSDRPLRPSRDGLPRAFECSRRRLVSWLHRAPA
jgi:hypothetical protein